MSKQQGACYSSLKHRKDKWVNVRDLEKEVKKIKYDYKKLLHEVETLRLRGNTAQDFINEDLDNRLTLLERGRVGCLDRFWLWLGK